MNYFKPLAEVFGAIAQDQDFGELTGGRPPEKTALLLMDSDFYADQLATTWATAFHLSYVTGHLESFEQSIKACGYYSPWAPRVLPNLEFVKFLRINSQDFSGRTLAFFRLARLYSSDVKLHVPQEGGYETHLFLENREKNLCQELAQRIIWDVGIGHKKLSYEDYDHYRGFVEHFMESFDKAHVEMAMDSVVSLGHRAKNKDAFFSNLEVIQDLLPDAE